MSSFHPESNPLMEKWENGFPPFARIQACHYKPAIEYGFKMNLAAIENIVASKEEASFENTVVEFDRCAEPLTQTLKVFFNLCSSHCPPELQAVEREMAAPIAGHRSSVYTYPGLFQRVETVYESRHEYSLGDEDIRLIERVYLDFVRAGAKLDEKAQTRYKEISTELAVLTTQFAQNVTADETAFTLPLDPEKKEDLEGLPDFLVEAAKQAAVERGLPGAVITLSRSLIEPFLTFSARRDLREKSWRAWVQRGELDDSRDNNVLVKKILLLRNEQAAIHNYQNYAAFATADTMAQTPDAVMNLLERVWEPAKLSLEKEKVALAEAMEALPSDQRFEIEAWDWRYLAEKVRVSKFDIDEATLKPYFPLHRMLAALFDCAKQLFGLTFTLRPDLQTYHPDVLAYEVTEAVMQEGGPKDITVAIFLQDNFSRPFKKSGAWMSDYRSQSRNNQEKLMVTPIVVNNNNFAKSTDSLLSFDDCVTMFHEFGHGLHGMLSNVTYNRLAGTNVLKDFVELPSQLFEHWIRQPTVLAKHALHFKTHQSIPEELLARLLKARSFNQGFATCEYTISALIDQSVHKLNAEELAALNVSAFEAQECQRYGLPRELVPRHKLLHFQHLFAASTGYAAAYYVYLWAEVLDADGFDAFLETGDIFNPDVAARVRRYIYSSGNSMEPGMAFRLFRGRDPVVEPMLKKKGLLVASQE